MPIPLDRDSLYKKLDAGKKETNDKIDLLNSNVKFLVENFQKVIKLSKKK